MPNINPYANPWGGIVDPFGSLPDFQKGYFNTNPEAGYSYASALLGGSKPFQDWFSNTYGRYYGNYQTAMANRSTNGGNYDWTDYLTEMLGQNQWGNEYQLMSPSDRREQPGLYAPKSRWIR